MKSIIQLLLPALVIAPVVALAQNPLLPFQGHLTNSDGTPIGDDTRLIQFKVYDAPIGGQALWAGEVHKLSINDGLVNTILGSKTSFADVDFSTSRYLEITVDANADEQISPADPPLLPRQIILPALFANNASHATNSDRLDGFDWGVILKNGNDPTVHKIDGSRIANESIGRDQVKLFPLTGNDIIDLEIGTTELQDQSVTLPKLAARKIVEADNIGEIGDIVRVSQTEEHTLTEPTLTDVPEFELTLKTSGRPVMLFLSAQGKSEDGSWIELYRDGSTTPLSWISFARNDEVLAEFVIQGHPAGQHVGLRILPSLQFLDTPPAGTHTYKLKARTERPDNHLRFVAVSMVAYEL